MGQNGITVFIFSYFAMKTGGVTSVVPLAPSPYDHAGDIHVFY